MPKQWEVYPVSDRIGVRRGTLALVVLKTLEATGPLHGYEIARRTGQTTAILERFFAPLKES